MAVPQTKEAPERAGIFTIESKVDVALVPVLVRDAQGRAVGNLKKEDFQVFDNGKPQDTVAATITVVILRDFSSEGSGARRPICAPAYDPLHAGSLASSG